MSDCVITSSVKLFLDPYYKDLLIITQRGNVQIVIFFHNGYSYDAAKSLFMENRYL